MKNLLTFKQTILLLIIGSFVAAAFLVQSITRHPVKTVVKIPQTPATSVPTSISAPAKISGPNSVALSPLKADAAIVELPQKSTLPGNLMRITATQVLSRVNGKLIQLKDLMPVSSDTQEATMTLDEFESRMERAIQASLVFQEAERLNAVLTPEQQQRLEKIAQDHATALQGLTNQGISWSSIGPAQLDFEIRFTSAQMLQQNLVAKETSLAPSPNPAAQTRYEQARQALLARLQAKADIIKLPKSN